MEIDMRVIGYVTLGIAWAAVIYFIALATLRFIVAVIRQLRRKEGK